MRITKETRFRLNLERLATHYGIASPGFRFGDPGWGCRGCYHPGWTLIILRRESPLETLIHEFAHHLLYATGRHNPDNCHDKEFENTLKDLRVYVAGEECRHLTFEGMNLDRVPTDWRYPNDHWGA